jgi:hypothetical protein
MRYTLHNTLTTVKVLALVLGTSFLLTPLAEAKGGKGVRRGQTVRTRVGHQPPVYAGNGLAVVALDYGSVYWDYTPGFEPGTALTPYGVIQYTPCGYGWTLPYYYMPYWGDSDGTW